MSTLRFYFIEGQRRQACLHDAVSVVREHENGRPEVIDIIPAGALPGDTRTEKLKSAPLVYAGHLPRLV
jgi:hypothetical protein